MDPNVAQAIDEMLKRFEDFDTRSAARWERLEKRIDDAAVALHERSVAVDARFESLERFAASQYSAADVADNWGNHINACVDDLEQRVLDVELVRVSELCDERDDRVAALEGAMGSVQSWRQEVDGHIDDLHIDVRRLLKSAPPPYTAPGARFESAATARSSGGAPVDWPHGHRVQSTTRAPAYGSVTTIVPTPANVVPSTEGRKSMLKMAERMVISYCSCVKHPMTQKQRG